MSITRSVKRTIADLKLFGRGYLRNPIGLFFGIIFPIILIVLFGMIFSGTTGKITVYTQNQDTEAVPPPFINISETFLTALNETGTLNVQMVDASEDLPTYLSSKTSSDGIILPANFSLTYEMGIPLNITVYGNPTQSSSAIVSGTLDAVVNQFNLKYYNQNATSIINVKQTTFSGTPNYIDNLVPGLIGFSILISPMFAMVNISAEYKKSKLFKQLTLTPLTKMEWLTSKVLWYVFLSAISFLILAAVGIYGFGAHIALDPWLIPFLILGPMLFCSLGMLVGTLSKSVETASIIGNVITFPMMFLSGTFFPLAIMPDYLRTFAHVLPLYYVVDGLNSVMVYANYNAAMIDIAVVAVITIIVFVAAAKLFKWRED
jgi:ABC-2 type transport system permease protein